MIRRFLRALAMVVVLFGLVVGINTCWQGPRQARAPAEPALSPVAQLGAVAGNLYRFMPIRFDSGALSRPHGSDERIAVSSLADRVRFHQRLPHAAAGPAAHEGKPS